MYTELTPQEIVYELNKFIIGQDDAKKAVAIALRNRWRRMQLSDEFRNEITPKNILMIGPTGVGKTEIARRLAKLSNSPFIKVEATKFTEVGYVGKEVDSIIRDLVDYAIKMIKMQSIKINMCKARKIAEERIVNIILSNNKNIDKNNYPQYKIDKNILLDKLRNGILDNDIIEINITTPSFGIEIMSPPGMEEMTNQLQSIFQNISSQKKKVRKLRIKDAIKLLIDEESTKLLNFDSLKRKAIDLVEQQGIVFIDEIDKVCKRGGSSSDSGISREGVQRDLLPLVEGCTVSTKYGVVKTDYILFIASGAFQFCSPSDLIPELQGRLPIKVELKALTAHDFERILIEPNISITSQYKALLNVEGVEIIFTDDGIKYLADISWKINENTENIGARRLHTVLEKLMEDISYRANDYKNKSILINSDYVKNKLDNLFVNEDLSKFIL